MLRLTVKKYYFFQAVKSLYAKNLPKPFFFIIAFLFYMLECSGQTILEGNVTALSGKPLPNVSVTVSRLSSKNVIAFGITGINGAYKVTVNSKEDSVQIRVSLLGYETIERPILNKSATLPFSLIPGAVTLKEVVVKNSPIRLTKDTLNYSVQSFASKEDRTIADVIKKLPGLEIQDDGKIVYQGKPIQAFLVNGLDLLEGRYTLASNNLPHDAVKNVQVIENDQRIKVLDSLVFSDRTTLNLQLKKFLTTGTAGIGAGGLPILWDVNLTPITYNKTFQAINTYQSNNIGKDKSTQLRVLTSDNFFEGPNKPNADLLSVQQPSPPPFDQKFWLDNNQHLFSSNILKILGKDLQIKFNISYVTDYQQKYGTANTSISIPGQPNITLTEVKNNGQNKNSFKSGFILEKNTKKQYMKNTFLFEKEWSNTIGNLTNGNTNIYQNLSGTPVSVSNKISLIKAFGKQLINLNSSISYNTFSQMLGVKPGQFDSTFNNNIPYDAVVQYAKLKTFQTNNYISFVKGISRFTLSPKLGVEFRDQSMESYINTVTSNISKELGSNFQNTLSLGKLNIYEELNTQYRYGDFVTGLAIRLSEQDYKLRDGIRQNFNELNRVLLEPQFNIRGKIKQNTEISVYSTATNSFGEISQLYSAYILQSYRSLQRLNSTMPESFSLSNGISINYKNPLKGVFFSIGYSIANIKNNLVFRNAYNPDGSTTLESMVKDNHQRSQSINALFSKYIGNIKTVFKLSGRFSFNNSEQIINNALSQIHGNSSVLGINITNSFLKHLSLDYDALFSFTYNRLNGNQISDIQIHQHNFKLNFFPVQNQMVTLNSRYYYNSRNSQPNHVFTDLLYRYTLHKRKIDFELNCNNLLNAGNYTTVSGDGYIIVEKQF